MNATYPDYLLQTIMPAPGWQAVHYDAEHGTHALEPVHALALARLTVYECHTKRLLREDPPAIVGMVFDVGEGLYVADEDSNYCGLLPPGMALEQFVVQHYCPHRPRPQAVQA